MVVELTESERAALRVATRRLAELAREEDLGPGDTSAGLLAGRGSGDVSADLLAERGPGRFHLVAREECVLAGQAVVGEILDAYALQGGVTPEGGVTLEWAAGVADGMVAAPVPRVLADVRGNVPAVLTLERVLLNFLQRLCGVASQTRRYVEAVAGTGAVILDTRKTTPGWRRLEKYAVRCGGGRNHRMGLHDAILIKDNHLSQYPVERTAAAVFAMLNRAAEAGVRPTFVEVEADCLGQVAQLLTVVGVDVILLDNFSLADLRAAVAMRAASNLAGKVKLEASGGVRLETVRAIAETGVDYISVGALTHSARAVDLALDRCG